MGRAEQLRGEAEARSDKLADMLTESSDALEESEDELEESMARLKEYADKAATAVRLDKLLLVGSGAAWAAEVAADMNTGTCLRPWGCAVLAALVVRAVVRLWGSWF